MNRKRIFTCICCVLLALCMAPAAHAAGMTAAVVTGPVVMNGQTIDNTTAQYPLLMYSNVTYVPMTYNLCRFMGLSTDWDNSTKTLSIDKSQERGSYVPDTGGSRRSGSVAVTRVTNPVVVRGVPVDNSAESHPLFLYNGVTYFPLTFDYVVNAFGWTYTWDAADGLDITCQEGAAIPSAAVSTGTPSLDAALEILNAFYQQRHTYAGSLADNYGNVQTFDASVDFYKSFYGTSVKLTAEPFVFFENGVYVSMDYSAEKNLTDEPGFSTGGGLAFTGDRPGPYVNHVPPEDISKTETGYIARCFLDCQFSGARAGKIKSFSQEKTGVLTTWHLTVKLEECGFTEYNAAFTIDESRNTIAYIDIETENYLLHMSVQS